MSPFVQSSDDFRRCGFKIGKIPGREGLDRDPNFSLLYPIARSGPSD
jgi:hypothetical protein